MCPHCVQPVAAAGPVQPGTGSHAPAAPGGMAAAAAGRWGRGAGAGGVVMVWLVVGEYRGGGLGDGRCMNG